VLTVSVGQTSQTVETWALDGMMAGETDLVVRLPALAHSVVIRADETARARIAKLSLRAESVRPSEADDGAYIIRASRYGHVRTFLLDDDVYLEPEGMWTRGNSIARIAVVSDVARATLALQAGPVRTTIDLGEGVGTSASISGLARPAE
jgi:hypothetical protein